MWIKLMGLSCAGSFLCVCAGAIALHLRLVPLPRRTGGVLHLLIRRSGGGCRRYVLFNLAAGPSGFASYATDWVACGTL